jgi:hypothetical protein
MFPAESPTRVQIDKVGDEGQSVTASAGEDVELVCTVSGGNPPAKVRWLLRDEELHSGHTQEDARAAKNARTWISTSRLTLPVSRADNGAIIRCLAEHPTLEAPLSTKTTLVIHCKHLYCIVNIQKRNQSLFECSMRRSELGF